jgi:hypothetical protein
VPARLVVTSGQNIDGVPDAMAAALVQESDAAGNITRSYEVANLPANPADAGTAFGFGTDIVVPDSDVSLLFYSVLGASVTVSVYGEGSPASPAYEIVASAQIVLPPNAPVARTLSQIFATSPDFAAFISQNPPAGSLWSPNQNLIALNSRGTFSVSVSRLNPLPDHGLIVTQSFAFPLAPTSSDRQSPQRPTPPLHGPGRRP